MSEKVPPSWTQNTVLNSTEIYIFFAIFGKNYLPVVNCTKIANVGGKKDTAKRWGEKGLSSIYILNSTRI